MCKWLQVKTNTCGILGGRSPHPAQVISISIFYIVNNHRAIPALASVRFTAAAGANLRTMQALARPRMTRMVLTSGQDEENGDDRRGERPAEGLARYYASCYVETP